ncbi:LysM peptidoglycan-binding domain-containing protein [Mesorhizobium sp. M1340]|uniref:LysM peptidoglycan-binding domain-containing protein n=1 Tax=unclassified Mesorhizobium TaxID=325217 RepID=UPI0033362295
MAINPLKAFLFAAGGSVAAAGTAYLSGALDPYLNSTRPAEVAALTPPASKPVAPATEGRLPPAPAASTDAAAPAAPTAAGAIVPTFDIVRVESNGSIVVAGNAAPNAKVEILNGSTVLGSTVAGPDGAFAIILDDPLKPGDYTITLRSTAGNVVTASAQTAVVSIPQNSTGQVLAMVEEPGKPSELLTVPAPEAKSDAALPATGAELPAAAAPAAIEAAPAPVAPATPAAPAAPAAEPKIVVEAVEIDGNKIFIAGVTDPGRKVRAYANDILLGDAKTSPDRHFLVEATRDIPVGTYTIHVDALDADGVRVVARAAVPFEREPGEAVAAVAPAEPKPAEIKPAEPNAPATKAAPATPATAAETPATPTPATEAPAEMAATTPSGETPETVAPKLEHADGAVIIRRHDTLWRISRRVYGQGMRYSTIYLANQDQISNPNRIWPGQVFKVPEKSKEGEPADLKAMGDQMTTAPVKTE